MANRFAHFELNTDDVAKAKKFYGKIFDWEITPMPAMDYTMIRAGDTGGGMQKKPVAGAPTHWLSYVEVASVKATLAKAQKAGATIVQPYMPIGEMGAIGVFVDPQGAALGLWEKSEAPAAPPPPAKKAAKKKAAAKKAAPAKAAKKAAPAKAAKTTAAKKKR